MDDRKERLLKRIEEARKISLTQLSEEFGISELTVRRDLKPLEESRKITIGKGEVLFLPDAPLSDTTTLEPGEEIVASMGAALIEKKDRIVWLGGGNISQGIARKLTHVTLVTNSLKTASAALKREGVKVFLLGDEVDPDTFCLHGRSLEMIKEFTFNKAFIEAEGYFNKRFLLSSRAAETVSHLAGNVLEKIIVIRGKDFGNVQTDRLKGIKEFKGVYTDTIPRPILKEIRDIPLKVVSPHIEIEERNEKVIPIHGIKD